MGIKVVLLDLGGVLIDVNSANRLAQLANPPQTPDMMGKKWAQSHWLRLFESGQCDQDAFARGAVWELGLTLTPAAFLDEFRLFLTGYYPGAQELLEQARSKTALACLTDTNALQWNSLCERTGIDRFFQDHFLSYQVGALKPDAAVYRHVIEALKCDPGDIVYFDDREANVQAGMDAGMKACQAKGVEGLRFWMTRLGLL